MFVVVCVNSNNKRVEKISPFVVVCWPVSPIYAPCSKKERVNRWSHGPWCRPLDPNSKQQSTLSVCLFCLFALMIDCHPWRSLLPFGLFSLPSLFFLHLISTLHHPSPINSTTITTPLCTHHLFFFFLQSSLFSMCFLPSVPFRTPLLKKYNPAPLLNPTVSQ